MLAIHLSNLVRKPVFGKQEDGDDVDNLEDEDEEDEEVLINESAELYEDRVVQKI